MEIMNEKGWEKLIKTIDSEVMPPERLKEKLLDKVFVSDYATGLILTPFERFIFEKPLRTASCIAFSISGLLWVVMGSGFAKLFSGIIG